MGTQTLLSWISRCSGVTSRISSVRMLRTYIGFAAAIGQAPAVVSSDPYHLTAE